MAIGVCRSYSDKPNDENRTSQTVFFVLVQEAILINEYLRECNMNEDRDVQGIISLQSIPADPDSPAGGGGPGRFRMPGPLGADMRSPIYPADRIESAYQISSSARAPRLSFSQWAEKKMWDLYKDHAHEVGSHYAGDRTGKQATDCITYIKHVLMYAYGKIGKRDVADQILKIWQDTRSGTDLGKYLVSIDWHAYYWNPDVRLSKDGQSEHPSSYKNMVKKTGLYYGIPINGCIINYNPTPGSATNQSKKMGAFERFSRVRFAYAIARGGLHTFMCSYGMVFEVHWDEIGEKLYETSAFYYYQYLSGLVFIPPDTNFEADPVDG